MTLTTSGIDYTVEIAFGIDPLDVPSGGDWVDVTEYVRGFSTRRGRNHELGRTSAGVATIRLDNRDRRFDPTFADANLVPLQNQRDVEAALGANQLVAVAGAVVARTTTAGQFSQGIAGLSITAHATNTNSGATVGAASGTTNVIAVDENQTYTFAVQLKGSGAHTFYLRARWLDSGGTAISNTDGPNTVVGAGAFAKYTHTATAPPTAAFVRFQILYPAAGAAQVMYADEFQAQWGTASTAWPAAAPYYPDVVPMAQLKIEATYAAVTYPVFYGFVEDWGQTWPEPAANAQGDAVIELQAVDAFKVFETLNLTAYPSAVAQDNPVSYYRLGEGEAGVAFDDAGDNDGAYQDTTLFEAGPLIGSPLVPDFAGVGQVVLPDDAFDDLIDKTMSVECWIRPEVLSSDRIVWGDDVFDLTNNTGDDLLWRYTSTNAFNIPGTTATAVLAINNWYHVAAVRDWETGTLTIYLNGAEVASDTFGRWQTGTSRTGYSISETAAFNGRIAHVAIYPTALSSERVAAHYASAVDTLAGTSGETLDAILDAAGWPAGLRDIDPGASTVAITPTGSALSLIQEVAEETEQGIFHMAADNTATFIDRNTLQASLTAVATFGDSTGEVPYADLVLSYDDQDLWTEVTASGADTGAVVVTDPTAAARYGTRWLEVSGVASSLNDTADLANGLLARYKDPHTRPVSVTMNKPAAFPTMLGRLIGDRVTVKRRPPGGGTISVDAFIEGVDHDAGPDGWLTTTFALVPVEPDVFWILADSTYGVLDSTTRLGW